MPRVLLVYQASGDRYVEYDVPQEVVDKGADFVEEYVWDVSLRPLFSKDSTKVSFTEMRTAYARRDLIR